jgi:hypothetical protein
MKDYNYSKRLVASAGEELFKALSKRIELEDDDFEVSSYTTALTISIRHIEEAISEVSNFWEFEEDEKYICDFGANFHTMLRKYYDGYSDGFLYSAIDKYGAAWNNLLKAIAVDNKIYTPNKHPIHKLDYFSRTDTYGDYELFKFIKLFFIENPKEEVIKNYISIFENE